MELGWPKLPSKNLNYELVVVGRGNSAGKRLPQPEGRDSLAPLEVSTSTQSFPFSFNSDSYLYYAVVVF